MLSDNRLDATLDDGIEDCPHEGPHVDSTDDNLEVRAEDELSDPVIFATNISVDGADDDIAGNQPEEVRTLSIPSPRKRGRDRGVIQPNERSLNGLGSESSASNNSSNPRHASTSMGKSSLNKGRGKASQRSGLGTDSLNVVNATEITSVGTGLYEGLATTQPDKLTGLFNNAKVKTTYTWANLTDSLLTVHGRPGYDIVENFTTSNAEGGSDELRAPQTITTDSITFSNGNIRKLNAGQINAKVLTKTNFLANSAAAFTCSGFDGMFVAFNDARDGYQQKTDTLLFLQGYNINSGPLVVS